MTVLEKVEESVCTELVIAATKPAPCVICGAVGERRYGRCFVCAEVTDFEDPRVLHESRLHDPLAGAPKDAN